MVSAKIWLDNHEQYNTKEKIAEVSELHLNKKLEVTLYLEYFN